MVIPFSTGGSVDAVLRVLKPMLEAELKQPIIPDYRPGGATALGAAKVARARPDGYTFGIVVDALAVNATLYRNLPYDTLTDLMPVSLLGKMPLVMIVHPAAPFNDIASLVAAARARSGALTYASVGVGSINHLAMELLNRQSGITMTHVPYRGGGPAVTDLLGRHVDMMLMSLALARAQLEAGTLKAVAVTSASRLAPLPSLPTASEGGIPGFTAFAWQGVVAPPGTPSRLCALRSGMITVRRFRSLRPRSSKAVTRTGSFTAPVAMVKRSPGRTPRSAASSVPIMASPGARPQAPATSFSRRLTMRW
jgi:tripartite-type tricarboxylate transporter receptor subunit TctC